MKIKKVVLSVVVMCLLVFPIKSYSFLLNNFKIGSEPDGFRGIKWGQDISTLKDMIFINYSLPNNDDLKEYKRNGDLLIIGTAHLRNLSYHFWRNKLYFGFAEFKDSNNWKAIKDICFKMFGEGNNKIFKSSKTKNTGGIETYTWDGKTTVLEISYWHERNIGSFSISSQDIITKEAIWNYTKAKERAIKKEGF